MSLHFAWCLYSSIGTSLAASASRWRLVRKGKDASQPVLFLQEICTSTLEAFNLPAANPFSAKIWRIDVANHKLDIQE